MADVFISFIHEEEKIASAVKDMLIAKLGRNRQVFLSADSWQMRAGEIWLDRIKEELIPAKVLLLLLSPNSIVRPWVNFEAGAAWLTGKAIIPVCFAGLRKEELPKPYSNFQAVDLREEYYYLVRSVAGWLKEGKLPSITPPPFYPFDHELTLDGEVAKFQADKTILRLYGELDRLTDG